MGHQRPLQDPFSDNADQLPSQFYLVDSATGEYRQYSAVHGYSASSNPGAVTASVQPSMQAALPEPVPTMLPVPMPMPIAVGSSAATRGSAHHHHSQGQQQQQPQQHLQHHSQDHNAYIDHLPPAAPPSSTTLLTAPHPQLGHHNHNHHRHLPPQPHPRPPHQLPLHPLPLQSQPAHRFPGRPLTMASSDEHGMAAQQEAARAYQPNLDGPIIGERTPIAAIVDEYAKADPIYVDKTMALPHTYMSYRRVKGDGNCGWRGKLPDFSPTHDIRILLLTPALIAIGFCYFEKLVEAGDPDQVEGEAARLMSMNHFLGTVGGYDYYEDWADEAIGLLRELAGCVGEDAARARALIHERWTDVGTGSALIYYLRLLAATHLKGHPAQYDPFVPDGGGIQAYCAGSVELPDREIEQLGIIALYNCLLKPLDFVLEIAYLDRSPGSEVNTYRFPEDANGKDPAALGPMIHLLYRPDHYDILYRHGEPIATPSSSSSLPLPPQPGPVSMQVNRATDLYSHTPINSTHSNLGAFATADFGLLASLPSAATSSMSGLSSPNLMHAPLSSSSCGAFVPGGQWMPPLSTHTTQNAAAAALRHTAAPENVVNSPGPKPPPPPAAPDAECNIRFTKMQYNYEEDSSRAALLGLLPFNVTTTTFKNSVWNRAHFGNPEFRPEQWRPGDDGADDRTRKKKGGGGGGSSSSAAKET